MTESSKPPSGRRMKARAPPPPPQAPQPAPRHIFRNTVPDGGGTSGMEAKENMLQPTVDLQLTLPQGHQTSVTEDGSKALMDLLVELCSRYHLNPALHTLELLSPEGHTLGFKPNALLGSLNVACVLIKERVWEEKVVRRPAPKVPETARPVKPVRANSKKTVRLMVNYHGSQKAVVRVNPLVPLHALIPVICDKCEFDPEHVLLLKDSVSHHELPLDRSLTELGIKELYVHDQSLDSIRSSTTSLGKAEKKGLLGIFQFSRRKNKAETTSLDMDDYDDKVIQNTDSESNGLSTVSGMVEERPSTLGQSQSVMTLPGMSPQAENKKRRAPALPGAPTPSMRHTNYESYQMGLGSESQQRKRKAPAPPPTPSSITPGSEDSSPSAAPTPDSPASEKPTPVFHTKVVQSTTISSSTVVTQTVKPAPPKTAEPPLPVDAVTPTPSSPTPSSSTTDSLPIQDSSSELSHSLDDSDPDFDQASTLTSSTASGSARVQHSAKSSSKKMEESEKISSVKVNQDTTSASSSRSETESALNLKLDEVENQRHSAMGSFERPVPPKPRRYTASESPQLVPPTTPSPPLIAPTESIPPESPVEEAAPQSWLHSMQSAIASSQKPEAPEEETMSLGSSSGGSSLPDQGYAEGMAEGEDSGMISSPSDTQPTSPDGSLSLDGSSGGRGERLLGPVRDNSSDSDEGCATWGSRHRHNDISQKEKTGKLKGSYEDDHDVTAQLHQTLADFEADLAAHTGIPSVEKVSYTLSTDSNDVPVSVVDMDVPVTAIDEILEDIEHNIVENTSKSLTRTESTGSKGPRFCHQSSAELENKNNNACTAADSNNSSSAQTRQWTEPEQQTKSQENKSKGDRKVEKTPEIKIKETSITDTNKVKKDKERTSAVKSEAETVKHSRNIDIKPDPVKTSAQSFHENKPVLPPTTQRSTSREEEMQRVYQNNSSSSASYGKITRSVTSRFGMSTFTVVPPKPPVMHAAVEPAASLTVGAIKIDDQGNMVKAGTISRNKFGGSSELGVNSSEGSPLLGKAKAFWSSNERQDSAVPPNKGVIDKAKESTDGLKSPPAATAETTVKIINAEDTRTTQFTFHQPAERSQPKEAPKEEARESVMDIKVSREEREEMQSKISVSKSIQQPSSKPVLPPPILPNLKKDLSFLKTSRRTSSQYVASAINKYTPKTSAKPSFIPSTPDSSTSLKTQTFGFQRSGRSIQVNPQLSSQSSLSENKENESASKFNPPGPKRSMSYPEYVSDSQRDFGEVKVDKGGFGSSVGSTKGISITLETETTKNMLVQSSGPTQINVTANNERDETKHVRQRSLSPALRSPVRSSAKPPTAPKTVFQGLTHDTRDTMKTTHHRTTDVKPQPSDTVTDRAVMPKPSPVTLFGPVKKFKPVICRSVEKDTSLHSSLMDAIQTGGGRERLKKISTAGPSSTKKASYAEEENERSALLAALRAPSTTGRLKKTKSEAADELEKFRKASEDEWRAECPSSPSPPSLTCTSPPVFTPPPPPPAPMLAPPPPPPVLPKGKPSSVTHPSANALVNPALAREAMLEAIRSGSAVERLKKVAVPTKTHKVNGRLGTIQATSSSLPQQ
ncbi:protein cordon-bleu isoform X3 [Notolabrus celidotus]|uniref:protein cordon-bleu isoform X3 n=1 Tax=Notolabrus celidotus TaxID=1203425 RepID=UPI00149046C0|nr:protein cordon-bleu isoform X3 [Notolabrus celidotus]